MSEKSEGRSAKILVVEDEAIIAKDMERRLKKNGYAVTSIAATGSDAVKRAGEDAPDLILMDIVLPGELDGIDAAGLIRTQWDIPVIYVTAYSGKEVLERAITTEPYGYITKPFEDSELCRTIEMALFKNRMERKVKEQAGEIQERNVALKVLLEEREKDRLEFEKRILDNISHLVLPYIEKLKSIRVTPEVMTWVDLLEANLEKITSEFSDRLSSSVIGLTPQELKIANLVQRGKQDKEIAEILNVSFETVKTHKQNIRKKLGIYGKRVNLRAYLAEFDV